MDETKRIVLDKKQWLDFCKNLETLSKFCYDVDIVGGMIRQASNDKFTVIEMNMISFLGDSSFAIRGIKGVIDFLKALTNGEVTMELDQKKLIYSNGTTSFTFRNPKDRSNLSNKFIEKKELEFVLHGKTG